MSKSVTVQQPIKYVVRGVPGPPGDQTSPFDYVLLNALGGSPPDQEGAFVWNPVDQTLDINNGTITIQVGQEVVIRGVNKTGTQIDDGSAVSIVGALGDRPKFVLADVATASADSFIGLSTHDIADNAEGFVTVIGLVRNLDTSAFLEGDVIYVDSTAGTLTNVKPVSGRVIKVGTCTTSHLNIGTILVDTSISFWTAEEEAALRALIA